MRKTDPIPRQWSDMTAQTVFARCIALSGSRLLSERLIGWSGRWTLVGDFLVCTQCRAAQAVDEANRPFTHMPGCVASQHGLYPWNELQQILNKLPTSPQELCP